MNVAFVSEQNNRISSYTNGKCLSNGRTICFSQKAAFDGFSKGYKIQYLLQPAFSRTVVYYCINKELQRHKLTGFMKQRICYFEAKGKKYWLYRAMGNVSQD